MKGKAAKPFPFHSFTPGIEWLIHKYILLVQYLAVGGSASRGARPPPSTLTNNMNLHYPGHTARQASEKGEQCVQDEGSCISS